MGVGHRKRTIARVMQSQNAYGHDLLEVLLFRAQPRRDMYDCATTLLDSFGSLGGVLSADLPSLTAVEGVGDNVAQYLKVLGMGINRIHGVYSFGVARSTAEFCRLVLSQNKRSEGDLLELYAVDIDGRVRMIIPINPPERTKNGILKRLLTAKAHGVFVLRRHQGLPDDVAEEKLVTAVRSACAAASVKMFDYCTKADGGFYSYFVHEKISGDRV